MEALDHTGLKHWNRERGFIALGHIENVIAWELREKKDRKLRVKKQGYSPEKESIGKEGHISWGRLGL